MNTFRLAIQQPHTLCIDKCAFNDSIPVSPLTLRIDKCALMTPSLSDRERDEDRGGAGMRSLEDREVSAMFHRDTLLARIVR